MNAFVENVLKEFFDSRNDIFETKSAFVRFECESVTAVDEPAESTSRIISGRIRYTRENGHQSLSPPLFLKLMPTIGKFTEGLLILFTNEMFFYSHVLPFFTNLEPSASSLFVNFYQGSTKTNPQFTEAVILLEYLEATKYKNAQQKSFLDYDHLSLMVNRLGKFHAYSYLAKEMRPHHFFAYAYSLNPIHFTTLGKMVGYLPKIGARGLEPLSLQDEYKAFVPAVQHLLDNADRLMVDMFKGQRYNKFSVVCHGDYLPGNILFQYNGERPVDLKFVDLAYSTYSSPVLDLALVLYVSADQKTRDLHWNHLIDDYYDGLSSLPVPIKGLPSKDEILGEFRTKAFYAYLVASYFLPQLIAIDCNMKRFQQLVPQKYDNWPLDEIPVQVQVDVFKRLGGDMGTEAVTDILKDMLNRGFIQDTSVLQNKNLCQTTNL